MSQKDRPSVLLVTSSEQTEIPITAEQREEYDRLCVETFEKMRKLAQQTRFLVQEVIEQIADTYTQSVYFVPFTPTSGKKEDAGEYPMAGIVYEVKRYANFWAIDDNERLGNHRPVDILATLVLMDGPDQSFPQVDVEAKEVEGKITKYKFSVNSTPTIGEPHDPFRVLKSAQKTIASLSYFYAVEEPFLSTVTLDGKPGHGMVIHDRGKKPIDWFVPH